MSKDKYTSIFSRQVEDIAFDKQEKCYEQLTVYRMVSLLFSVL